MAEEEEAESTCMGEFCGALKAKVAGGRFVKAIYYGLLTTPLFMFASSMSGIIAEAQVDMSRVQTVVQTEVHDPLAPRPPFPCPCCRATTTTTVENNATEPRRACTRARAPQS